MSARTPLRVLAPGILILSFCLPARGQTDGILQINDPVHTFLERQATLGNLQHTFLSHQPLSVYEAREYLDSLDARRWDLSRSDRDLLDRYRGVEPGPGANWARGVWGELYENGIDFLAIAGDGYGVQFNPLLYLSYGLAKQSARPDRDATMAVWQNTRGVRLSGHVGKYVFFETRIEENQVRLPDLAGLTNGERRGFAYRPDDNTFDYTLATGVIGFRSRFFEIRFGQDRHSWGNSPVSMLLSNYSVPHAFLQLRSTFGPFQYVSHFASLQDPAGERETGDLARPFKYASLHRLAYRPSPRLEIAFFESIVLAPTRNERNAGFYFTFLNPVVIYHTLNLDIGSPGNVMIGFDGRWSVADRVAVNGQFFIDDFEAGKFFSNPDYWKNTYGLSLGADVTDPGIPGLGLQVQYSRVRPYSYSNKLTSLSYVSRNGVMGFPLGPNTEAVSVFADYRIGSRISAALNASFARRGRNTAATNYGSNPLRPYTEDLPGDDVSLLDGVRQNVILLEGYVSYEILPHLFVDAALRYDYLDDAEDGLDRYLSPYVSLRWGLPYQSLRY